MQPAFRTDPVLGLVGFSSGDFYRFAMRNSNNFLFYNVLVGLLYMCMVRHDCELALRYVAPRVTMFASKI